MYFVSHIPIVVHSLSRRLFEGNIYYVGIELAAAYIRGRHLNGGRRLIEEIRYIYNYI